MRKLNLIINLSIFALTSATAVEVNLCYAAIPATLADTVVNILPDVQVKGQGVANEITSATPKVAITAENIKTRAITDISDAVRRLPGVTLRDYGGNGGLKTLSVRGLGSEHTAVLYDGVALSDCQSGQIDLSRYSLNNISGISLFSGDNDDLFIPARASASASSLYIDSFRANATEDKGNKLRAQMKVGSFGFYNPYLRWDYSDGNGTAIALNGEYIYAENDYPFTLKNGNIYTKERREHSLMNSWHTELSVRKQWNGKTLSGKLYYYDNSRDLPGPVIYYVSESNEHLRERNFFGQAQFKGRIATSLSLLANAKFNWASSRYKDYQDIYPGGMLHNYYIQRETYASAALLYIPGGSISADYSADWMWNNLTSNSATSTSPYRNSLLQTLAVKYKTDRLSVMVRALYSVYLNGSKRGEAGKNEYRLSPSVNFSYKPLAADFYIRGSYKNIFRLPTFNELYFDHYGSINLNPEITDQINLGLTYGGSPESWWSELSATLDGYVNFVKNKIVAVPYNMFVWRMSNIGKVRVFGIDATLSSTFDLTHNHQLLLTGTYSFQRAEPRTSRESPDWMKQVAYIPRNSGSASLSWLNPWANVAVHTTATGERFTTSSNLPETRIAGFAEFGVGVFRTFQFRRVSIEGRLDLLNLFNKQYEIVARYPMPGRSWRVGIDFNFI